MNKLSGRVDESSATISELETHVLSMKSNHAMANLKRTFTWLLGKQVQYCLTSWKMQVPFPTGLLATSIELS